MKTLVVKVVVMIGLIVFGLQQLERFFYKDDPFRLAVQSFKEMDPDLGSIIFFGSSHSYSSFDPRIIENELGVQSVNLGASAQRLVTTQAVADMVIRGDHKPHLAIVSVFEMSLKEPDEERFRGLQLRTLDFIPPSLKKNGIITEISPMEQWPEAMFKTIRYHENWHKPNDLNLQYNFLGKSDYFKGYFTYRMQYDSAMYKSYKKKYDGRNKAVDSLTKKQKKRIDDLITLFSDNDIRVLFVSAPSQAYTMSIDHYSYSKAISSYLKSKNQPFLELNESSFMENLDDTDYRNPNHLNTKGAIKTTRFLIDYIKDSLEIEPEEQHLDRSRNRYSYVDGTAETSLYYKELDSITTQKLFGIESAHLYQLRENWYELIFPLTTDTIGYQNFRVEHDITSAEVREYGRQKLNYNKDSTKTIFYGVFDQQDVLTYKNQSFVVYPFKSPLKKFRNLAFYGGDRRLTKVFSIDSLVIDP